VDLSVWPRSDAECSPERGFYYHPSRHSAGQPIVAGWAYQFIARLGFVRESWTSPVDALRVHPDRETNMAAAEQVKALLSRSQGEGAVPLFVFDAGYDPVKLQRGLEGSACRILVRLRAGRCFYADPSLSERPANPGRAAPPRPEDEVFRPGHLARTLHGARMRRRGLRGGASEGLGRDAPEGTGTRRSEQPRAFAHRGRDAHPGGSREAAQGREAARAEAAVALWWHGPEGTEPDLDLLWKAYVRRFDLEHTFRFLKQTLGWSAPRVRHPGQADRWTWLVLAAFAQLRLARAHVVDQRLPWERRYDPGRLTPIRVHRGVSALLARAWGRPPSRRNPAGDRPEGPKGASRVGPNAIRPSRRAPEPTENLPFRPFATDIKPVAKLLVVKTQAKRLRG
jgi:hypothetical protein